MCMLVCDFYDGALCLIFLSCVSQMYFCQNFYKIYHVGGLDVVASVLEFPLAFYVSRECE